ncbi:cytochrome c [Chitinasiproducens palmae]|uniref:Cytochrome c, mono-and diheme variants n=1 Tax=Chitinasiproducens palmae TaxID=1770053 RepID=A0A1H2PUC1_9BURK|nr:cytochrome c [Chitinasiproducens palmae]SDV50386.1 Cytochrome c, mono-and diheme variants [Chitinasiproducens palmae]
MNFAHCFRALGSALATTCLFASSVAWADPASMPATDSLPTQASGGASAQPGSAPPGSVAASAPRVPASAADAPYASRTWTSRDSGASFPAVARSPASPSLAPPASTPPAAANLPNGADAQAVARGAYLARAGDCVACHTAKGGQPFAGGLAIASPLGTIYSTNITPDRDTGIGTWQYDDFARLMRHGRTKDGYTVYPAMPYPSYSRLSDEDMKALYAYFMHGVPAVHQANRKNGIPWPLSMRWPLSLWARLFAPKPAPFQPRPGTDAEVARGAYLVQGLGHCGSCHTPRSVTLNEKALTDADGTVFLSGGGAIDGWIAPSLRNEHGGGLADWSKTDIVEFLKTGRTAHAASFGAMNDVIVDSTQYMSDADLNSIAAYLKSLPPRDGKTTPYRYDATIAKELYAGQVRDAGARIYVDRCAACHRSNGLGYGRAFPSLAGNPVLQTDDPTSAIHIILSGGSQPATFGAPSSLSMPSLAHLLNDQQIAEVVTFIQTSWGNQGGKASAEQVAKLRKLAKPIDAPGLAPMQRDLRHAAPGEGAGTAASGVAHGE